MTITESRVREIAVRHGVAPEVTAQILRDAGITLVPDFAGRAARPGDGVPTDRLHACELVGRLQPDRRVWIAKSPGGGRRRFVSQEDWYRLAEVVAQNGGQAYLHEPETD